MLSYRFNVSRSILVSHAGLLRLMQNPSTPVYTRQESDTTPIPHLLTRTHTHTHVHIHTPPPPSPPLPPRTHTHTQPDLSSNSSTDSQQPELTEFVSSVCWRKVSRCSSQLGSRFYPPVRACLLNTSVFHGICVIGSVAPYHVVTGLVTPQHTCILPESSLHVGSQVSGITVVLSSLSGHKAYSCSQ